MLKNLTPNNKLVLKIVAARIIAPVVIVVAAHVVANKISARLEAKN